MVPTALWRAVKKNSSTQRATERAKTLVIKAKYSTNKGLLSIMGPHLISIFIRKNIEMQRSQVGQFSPLDNNAAREFDSG